MDSKRPWDLHEKYTKGQLKEYPLWNVEVSYCQHTFGNFIIFAKENVEKISDLSTEALLELKTVMKDIEHALDTNPTFKPDRYNYWQMGNQLHHLHIHGIPRYQSTRYFADKEWIDRTWGHIPIWSKEELDEKLVRKLRDVMKIGL